MLGCCKPFQKSLVNLLDCHAAWLSACIIHVAAGNGLLAGSCWHSLKAETTFHDVGKTS